MTTTTVLIYTRIIVVAIILAILSVIIWITNQLSTSKEKNYRIAKDKVLTEKNKLSSDLNTIKQKINDIKNEIENNNNYILSQFDLMNKT